MKTFCTLTQNFGDNATATYQASGLKGHTGTDSQCGFDTNIKPYWFSYVYKTLTKENPSNDGTGFTGVFTIVDKGMDGCFEFLYGHCNPTVAVGQNIDIGDVLGTEANNGEVYSDGVRITLAMQKAGDQRGHHRHEQFRPLRKDKNIQPNTQYLTDNQGRFYYNGFYYAIPYYKNGFNGCADGFNPTFKSNLTYGSTSYDVERLQRFLIKNGYMTPIDTFGFYGNLTKDAVLRFQDKKMTLSWYERYVLRGTLVGNRTREIINSLL